MNRPFHELLGFYAIEMVFLFMSVIKTHLLSLTGDVDPVLIGTFGSDECLISMVNREWVTDSLYEGHNNNYF